MADPWLEGRVFNESWEHLIPSKFTYDDFRDITHLWFSHEHPDHFYPPNLKKIPEDIRKNISVLFQKTMDGKVIKFIRDLQFKEIIELSPDRDYMLGSDLRMRCSKVANDTDSWLYLNDGQNALLNLNDCVIDNAEEALSLKKQLGNIDMLFSQFSYAAWVGNKDDTDRKKKAAAHIIELLTLQIKAFNPKYVFPFASFVWFCHKDNFHMNTQANSIAAVSSHINHMGKQVVVLLPGEDWEVGSEKDFTLAIETYMLASASLPDRKLTTFDSVDIVDLKNAGERCRERCLALNNKAKLLTYNDFSAYLYDLNTTVTFSYKFGLRTQGEIEKQHADIAFHSQNLFYCLSWDWGWDTILVAGTFEKPIGGNFQRFMEYEWIGTLNNQGKRMDGLLKRFLRRLLKTNSSTT